jgi:FeS assembly SUF system protein
METIDKNKIEQEVIEELKTIYDPEIPVNIFDLGMIYEINVDDDGIVYVKMTLTAPNCPVAETLPMQVKERIMALPSLRGVSLELVWDPPWNIDMMSDEAKLLLGYM